MLKQLNHRHKQILNWLVLNPDRSLGECARQLGYTQSWLSLIIHSDMFQAEYRTACAEVGALAAYTITNELGALTHEVIEKSREKINGGQASERFLGQVLETSLRSLGYGTQPANGNGGSSVTVMVDARTITEARERAAVAKEGTTEAKLNGGGASYAQNGIIPLPSGRAALPSLAQVAVETLNPPSPLTGQDAVDALLQRSIE